MFDLSRRSLITGLIGFAATAPAIVRSASLMPVKQMLPDPAFVAVDLASGPSIGVTTIYFQNRLFWISNKDSQVIHYSEPVERPPWMTWTSMISPT